MYRILSKVAFSTHPVLIFGESGTGKEVVARAIHSNGPNAERPFVVVDCASMGVTALGSWYFLVLVSIGVALMAIEWGIMAAPNAAGRMAVAVAIAALAGLFVAYLQHPWLAILILLFGALCAGLFAYRLKSTWLDAA